jgi:hypothetical protein
MAADFENKAQAAILHKKRFQIIPEAIFETVQNIAIILLSSISICG